MHPVAHSLPEPLRTKLSERLNLRLADLIDLQAQYRLAHWNVRGPHFIALHELFGSLAGELDGAIDDVAERIAQLGGEAEGSLQVVVQRTGIPEASAGQIASIDRLTVAASGVASRVRTDIDDVAYLGDALTADLLTGIGRLLDKQVWFLDSHQRT
jgi:starvation-inducible DNA-binding protein